MKHQKCYHCGDRCPGKEFSLEANYFCCLGCLSVYEILHGHGFDKFYELNEHPGILPDEKPLHEYEFIDDEKIRSQLVDFHEGNSTVIRFFIPAMHCSSCIWLLENLPSLHQAVNSSTVNFSNKSVEIFFNSELCKLSELAKFLAKIGYKPLINLASLEKPPPPNRSLIYKMAVASFCFGNIMLLAFPEYIGAQGDPWLEKSQIFFHWVMLLISLPVMFYCASDYFISSYKALLNKFINIDVPISMGILVLFLRSLYEVLSNEGPGYFDSLSGLVFFLLIGRYFQMKTYQSLAFDRDYKWFYPIAVVGINPKGVKKNLLLSEIKKGDRILIRNEEIIPVDAVLIKGNARIDTSFITGEVKAVEKLPGDRIYAGGKQKGQAIEVEAIKEVEQSRLRQLWNNKIFQKKRSSIETTVNKWSKYFTFSVLFLALLTGIYWYSVDASKVFQAISAVLIVACPCALALAAPFTLGSLMRILAKRGLYVRDAEVIEQISKIDTLVFDKTGTLTEVDGMKITFSGDELSKKDKLRVGALVKNSKHPLSQLIYKHLNLREDFKFKQISEFEEIPGKGLRAIIEGLEVKLGSKSYLQPYSESKKNKQTQVLVLINSKILGGFTFLNKYRKDLGLTFEKLSNYRLSVLSGDNDSEKIHLTPLLPENTNILFYQTPQKKLNYIEALQKKGCKVMMLGDGLNDAGALKQSHVGVALCEDVNNFSPECDALMEAKALSLLPFFLKLSKVSIRLIMGSFIVSFIYNIIGLSFAMGGSLKPVVAAILMPVSSISVVLFASLSTRLAARLLKP